MWNFLIPIPLFGTVCLFGSNGSNQGGSNMYMEYGWSRNKSEHCNRAKTLLESAVH